MTTVIAGRFEITGPLGKGNMGEVHRAIDLDVDAGEETVAIKLLLNGRYGPLVAAAGSKAEQRFAREVAIMRRLEHENLPRTVDGGVDECGRPYLAMEFLDGRELSDLIEACPQLPVSWVAAIGAQVAAGLAAAHAQLVVHRDLKPANVMLVAGGLVKVLDFGLGQLIDATDTGLTSSGVTVGTARYMAPEQFHASTVTPAADLYALGCVMFELLTGQPPFHSASPLELGRKHREDAPPPLALLRRDVPADLDLLVGRLLRKDAQDRPESAVVVRDALAALAVGDDVVPGWAGANPVAWMARATPTLSTAVPPEERPSPRIRPLRLGVQVPLDGSSRSARPRPTSSARAGR